VRFIRVARATTIAVVFVVAMAMLAVTSSAAPRGAIQRPRQGSDLGSLMWSASIGSAVDFSSPTYGTINGTRVVADGSLDGRVYLFNAVTGAAMPGWSGGRPAIMFPGDAPSAIDSSPTIAYLDGPYKPPSIIVGVGSQSVKNQNGGLIAWNANGTRRFVFHTRHEFDQWGGETGKYDNSVFATPAVGHVLGTSQEDIVFGAFDHLIYALGPHGGLLPGFPIQRADTIWSSAALVERVKGPDDIIMGGDSTGLKTPRGVKCYGGWVTDYRYVPSRHAPKLMWERCLGQSVWSSPAVGVLNSTQRLAVVVGTSFNGVYSKIAATHELFAFYVSDGYGVPGWPVKTVGPSFGSPAIARMGRYASPVVVSSDCAACTHGPAVVEEWTGTGRRVWSVTVTPKYEMMASPAVANLTGSGPQDVLIGDTSGVHVYNGRTGVEVGGGVFVNGCRFFNTPAVFHVSSKRVPSSWEVVMSCTKDSQARLYAFALVHAPDQAPSWPEWRDTTNHTGYSGKS
jgi:hypothetical protein